MRFSEKLAVLGGADRDILRLVPSAVSQYVQFALVLLSTALTASISMWFALVQGMRVDGFAAVPFALVWGLVILNLDRYLTSSMQSTPSFKRALGMALPRLGMAALIGVVISTPLVLKVFESDINAEMTAYNLQHSAESSQPLNASALRQNVDRLQAEVTRLEQVLAGNNGSVTNPAVEEDKERIAELEASVTKQAAAVSEAQKLYICERYGTGRNELRDPSKCSPTPGPFGPFPQIEADFNKQTALLQDLQDQLQQARDKLSQDVSTSAGQQATALKTAQEQATQQLPDTQKKLATAKNDLAQLEGQVSASTLNDRGILAQLRALFTLGERNPLAGLAHWSIGGLFFMIELLPVIVKLMLSSGPPSLYERVKKLDGDSLVDEAKVRRNEDRRRIEEESRKRREIEDDMRHREKHLGIKANIHVASEMEKILEAALRQWSQEVSHTLHRTHTAKETRPPSPVANTLSGTAATPNGANPMPDPTTSNATNLTTPNATPNSVTPAPTPTPNRTTPNPNGTTSPVSPAAVSKSDAQVLEKFNVPSGGNL